MAPTLDDLPNELFERIVQFLGLPDICSLRSGSRLLASKATQRHFKSFFRRKHVDLDERSLAEFVYVTKPHRLGCLLEDLVLVGLTIDTSFLQRELNALPRSGANCHDPQQDLKSLLSRQDELRAFDSSKVGARLLTEAFHNLSCRESRRALSSLSLHTGLYVYHGRSHETPGHEARRGPDQVQYSPKSDQLGEAAARSFRIAMQALAASNLTVGKLDLFDGVGMEGCSLPGAELNDLETLYPGIGASLAPVQSISISLCKPPAIRGYRVDKGVTGEWKPVVGTRHMYGVRDNNVFTGLPELIRMAPQVIHLDIHFFTNSHSWSPDHHQQHSYSMNLWRNLATCDKLPKLQTCRIRGLRLDPADLVLFLQRTEPRHLSLQFLFSETDAWRPTLDYLTSPQTKIESFDIQDLFEANNRWRFDMSVDVSDLEEWVPGCCVIDRHNDSVKLLISYHPVRRWNGRDVSYLAWRRERRKEYGEQRWH